MEPVRVVGRIDFKGRQAINTIRLEGLRVVGKPEELAASYYNAGVDELILIDQVASLYQTPLKPELIELFSREVFIPLTVGGGVTSVCDAKSLLRAGADKIAVNSAVTKNSKLISELANSIGSQSVVVSIQAKQVSNGNWEIFRDGGRERVGVGVVEWAVLVEKMGAGEILLTSIDRDGTRTGFDIDLIQEVQSNINIPVVASGGLGSPDHAVRMISATGNKAFAVADFLHMNRGGGVADLKGALAKHHIVCRPLNYA